MSLLAYSFARAGRGPLAIGYLVLIPCLAALIVWSFLAPLSVAAIAPGELVVQQRRKSVQHLEGGIVETLFVREGQPVQEGDPLLLISDLPQQNRIDTLVDKIASATALRARLVAERDGSNTPDFQPLDAIDGLPPGRRQQLIGLHEGRFSARAQELAAKTELVRLRQKQAELEINSLEAQQVTLRRKLELLRNDFDGAAELHAKQIGTLTRRNEIERGILDIETELNSAAFGVDRARHTIASGEVEIATMLAENHRAVLDELQTTEVSLKEWQGERITLRDDVRRRIVRAPVSGRAMDLQIHTNGGVVAPGGRILDIVPEDDCTIIHARVNPTDIDLVRDGMAVKIILSAFKAKKVPKLDGVVLTVSADALTEPANGQRYFLAQVEVDAEGLQKLATKVELAPGMPAQVFFVGADRTFADYIMQPILDATYRAFREE